MSSQVSLTSIALASALAYALWRVFTFLTTPDPFRNIPGPEPASWINGAHCPLKSASVLTRDLRQEISCK